MPEAALTVTPSEAVGLFEEKVSRLRGEMGQVERSTRDAVATRDKALHEVTTLQQEKDAAINELARLKEQGEQLKATLAEHRKNVEASLAKQEAAANAAIEAAGKRQETLRAYESSLRQFGAQVDGVQQTLTALMTKALASLTKELQAVTEALDEIKLPTFPTPS